MFHFARLFYRLIFNPVIGWKRGDPAVAAVFEWVLARQPKPGNRGVMRICNSFDRNVLSFFVRRTDGVGRVGNPSVFLPLMDGMPFRPIFPKQFFCKYVYLVIL